MKGMREKLWKSQDLLYGVHHRIWESKVEHAELHVNQFLIPDPHRRGESTRQSEKNSSLR
jgi:hypothetical protein